MSNEQKEGLQCRPSQSAHEYLITSAANLISIVLCLPCGASEALALVAGVLSLLSVLTNKARYFLKPSWTLGPESPAEAGMLSGSYGIRRAAANCIDAQGPWNPIASFKSKSRLGWQNLQLPRASSLFRAAHIHSSGLWD